MKYAFFIAFLLVWIGTLVYSFWRGAQVFSVFSKGKVIFYSVMSVGILSFVLAMMLQDAMPVGLSRVVEFTGHTHNGQFFPVNLIVGAMYEKAYGLIQKGDAKIYVSSGLGLWGAPYRIGTQSEIVCIKMKWKK